MVEPTHFEKNICSSNWILFPRSGENNKYLKKSPPRVYLCLLKHENSSFAQKNARIFHAGKMTGWHEHIIYFMFYTHTHPTWMSCWKLGSMVRINGLFHLLISGIYRGYNQFTDHLLTSNRTSKYSSCHRRSSCRWDFEWRLSTGDSGQWRPTFLVSPTLGSFNVYTQLTEY